GRWQGVLLPPQRTRQLAQLRLAERWRSRHLRSRAEPEGTPRNPRAGRLNPQQLASHQTPRRNIPDGALLLLARSGNAASGLLRLRLTLVLHRLGPSRAPRDRGPGRGQLAAL